MDELTDRELQVLEVVAEGLTDKAAGARLFISDHTIKHHLNNIYFKLGIARGDGHNMRVFASRMYVDRLHDEHMSAIRAHLNSKHMNGNG